MSFVRKEGSNHYSIEPLVNGYWIQARLPNLLMRINDKFWQTILWLSRVFNKPSIDKKNIPRRVLLSNLANNGDIIICLSLVNAIKEYYPEIEIGFLVGSWGKGILNNHPQVNYTHYYDHWYMKQYKKPLLSKVVLNIKISRKIVKEIKKINYDAAFDLYQQFPNSIPLLWRAGIPKRYGYISGGFGPFLTNPHPWRLNDEQIAYNYLKLIRELLPKIPLDYKLKSCVVRNNKINIKEKYGLENKKYIICHPGCSSELRIWPIAKWIELKEKLLLKNYTLTFTGQGANEEELILNIISNSSNCINLCSTLNWVEFTEVTAGALCTFSADTSITHLAAAVDVPSVVLFGGLVNYKNLEPLSDKKIIVYNMQPCIPCYRRYGCEDLECIRGTSVDQVYAAIELWAERSKS